MNYTKIYNDIIERAKQRTLYGYGERHHIIPKCMGGINKKENIVKLTAREHFICHMLLTEMHPTISGLHYAAYLLICCHGPSKKQGYHTSARTYERLRIAYANAKSVATKGKNNNMFRKSVYDVWVEKYGIDEAKIKDTEMKIKQSKSLKGIKRTDEQKEHYRKSKLGSNNPMSRENRLKMGYIQAKRKK